jgi:alpha-amylase/alpha-mannosidase (GH57 family)
MDRYICIHAHFYQPPRENPWLEAIELQDSAYPYHDWNERITASCYAPNTASRILDGAGRILKIVDNYPKISFNFGPTLLSWLEVKAAEVYRVILSADKESQTLYSGHGSALAQAYNHMILPLANRRDKYTQVLWGIHDFRHRFGRMPEGMWLPETAVDLESLDIMAAEGIRFTILSPSQARRVRPLGGRSRTWNDVGGEQIDPSRAYRVTCRSGRSIAVFFYDGPISRAVAFEGVLIKGEYLADRLMHAFSESRTWPQIVHIATDGETYGHHHRYGDMALAYALDYIESNHLARLTNYGEFLEKYPPTHEIQVFDSSSWSCVHGIERWRTNCGCNSGMHLGWHQEWRAPLRDALNWLRDTLIPAYEQFGSRLFKNPWVARNDYIQVILDRSNENIENFLSTHAKRPLHEEEKIQALKLLELQRHAMLMYTSCGWFFDELSGIETVQVIQYAARALQLAKPFLGDSLESRFLSKLEQAKSNIPEHRDGQLVYEKFVRPAMIDLPKVGTHYAVSSVFNTNGTSSRTYCYAVQREDYKLLSAGKAKLALGQVQIISEITLESARVIFGVLHQGDHHVSGGVREFRDEEDYLAIVREMTDVFERGDFVELNRIVDKNFESGANTLRLLFRDEQRKILQTILESALAEAGAAYRHVYTNYAPLMRFATALGMPQKHFLMAAEFTLNADLHKAFEADHLDGEHINALLEEAKRAGIPLDEATLEFALRRNIERMVDQFHGNPLDLSLLQPFHSGIELARSLPFEVSLWSAQNAYYEAMQRSYPEMRGRADHAEEDARIWVSEFFALGEKLGFRMEE